MLVIRSVKKIYSITKKNKLLTSFFKQICKPTQGAKKIRMSLRRSLSSASSTEWYLMHRIRFIVNDCKILFRK